MSDKDTERVISGMLRAQERWLELTDEQRELARSMEALAVHRLRNAWWDTQDPRNHDGRQVVRFFPEGVNPNEDRQDEVDTERLG